ncbi:hypothetical protein SAMN02910456_00759 [Ruminococcaceae bacterium YRB3002]|nr:hypothetical protein SAMN02910456_00759 [Ruminococcaceae bacterium YRB3002]
MSENINNDNLPVASETIDNSRQEVVMELEDRSGVPEKSSGKKRKSGLALVILGIIVVLLAVVATIFYDAGGKEKLESPLTIHGKSISSADFSFMYHYTMIEEGIDLFASDTPALLDSPYTDDDKYSSYRNYFLDLTAQKMQEVEILYDDAVANGYSIENKHFERAEAYISWLKSQADKLGVSLDTYIKGVYGSQVDEQTVLKYLAKKYFADDYSNGAKLDILSASEEQALEAYENDRNSYDLVDYKILRITYEQREQAFVDTANLHAQQIIEAMGGDPSKFESSAAKYFSGTAKEQLEIPDSTLVANCRFSDFTHSDFRDWLFGVDRNPGDATVFSDRDGFPIILVFVQRQKLSQHLRDVYIAHIVSVADEEGNKSINTTQSLAQEIYEYIDDADSFSEAENLYNTDVLEGRLIITHSQMTYPEQYNENISNWIFDASRELGNKTIIEIDGDFFVIYFVKESEKTEWYDRVNSFVRMNNYREFMEAKSEEYTYEFDENGLSAIRDVP